MEKSCFNCKHYDQPSFEMKEFCWECLRQEEVYALWERKPITNADIIRAMSDEKLADKLEEIQLKTAKAYGNDDLLLKGELKKYWLDWLKQKVKEGEQ